MTFIFVVCAALGGTVLLLQFGMALVGLGGHALDADAPHDIGHGFGGDADGGDFDADGGDLDAGAFHGDHGGDASIEHDAGGAHHGTDWLFGVLSFRTIVAALAFFGLAGLAADAAETPRSTTLLIAVAAGAAAMVAVYWMMRGLRELRSEGNVRIGRALGCCGSVYLRVPANNSGSGKIQLNLQNRTMEYLAVTNGPELPTGTKVVVVSVVDPTTLEVCRQ